MSSPDCSPLLSCGVTVQNGDRVKNAVNETGFSKPFCGLAERDTGDEKGNHCQAKVVKTPEQRVGPS